MLKDVAELLSEIEAPGSFATRRTSTADDLRLEVKGVGPIRFPISAAMGRKLCARARPACYGLRNQTLLDKRVRDCWEIPKSRIKIEQRRWKKTLVPQLEQIGCDLGLSSGCKIKAELYNMLVYGPGQFFVSHRDTEKTHDMIGTMVVTLPSGFKGGAIVIEHYDEKVTYRAPRELLSFVAFYADCHHEVRPVKEGYRVVLTYNLLLKGDGNTSTLPAPPKQIDALTQRVRSHFETMLPPRWGSGPPREPPDRLVYLLDHQYTQSSLDWHRLKNNDAARVAALREVAERLDCEISLALADVHETWSCEDAYYGYGAGGRASRLFDEYDKPYQTEDPEDHTLIELVDSDIELRHWVGSKRKKLPQISSPVAGEEVCYTKAAVDMEPFASEHEGYMGNYGNTVDRWYHRVAMVLWPRERTFVVCAKASASWAIRELLKKLKAGSIGEARVMTERLLPFWRPMAEREQSRGFVEKTLRVAQGIQVPELAATLLQPFKLEQLTPQMAPLCATLLECYGREWVRTLLEHFASRHAGPERKAWLASIPRFCELLCSGGSADGTELARWLNRVQWAWVVAKHRQSRELLPGKYAADELLSLHKPILALLESSVVTDSPGLQREILEFPKSSDPTVAEIDCLVRLLRAAAAIHRPATLAALGLGSVHERCTRALRIRLDGPPRAADDWSMSAPSHCTCGLCQKLMSFLVARDQNRYEWPLAKAGRAHIHQILDRHDLPVSHQTRRSGRPHTLVLTKTKALFVRDSVTRKAWKADLDWLTKKRGRFLHRNLFCDRAAPRRE